MPADVRPLSIFLMGPTASGKTALACALADRFPVELISVDSALVYRGLDIGSAKPDAATLARYPHALIDIRDPAQPYSAADFREDALAAMETIRERGNVPLLVGGTGLYFRALQRGLSDLPEADPALRQTLAAEAASIGWAAMHARMAARDPVAGARIRPGDAQRIQRALEVMLLTGRPLTELQQTGTTQRFPWRVLKLALLPDDRSLLHERIARRFDEMLAAGFLDEVRQLKRRADLHADLPAIRAVGYRQAWEYLEGEGDATTFRNRAIYATRQLAKRQVTWLRSEYDARTFDPDRGDPTPEVARAVAQFVGMPRP
ncbi:tRNA (adenosine(37)-N6)-dimethylallyltransferase MiaA [Luteibacter sp. UNCMF366Tsu5.1]|uniref:tRNA (adenosine(37)-N6)-dimethylallyltransferase MiaA n=1 Tax=Luteibacter sp. UNCMF366Tsu5.1 TaxID=1502758 RepID=UPI0009091A35|nr:tRNA (adenosine(37)-N6)-dimethylallyltransferase MiaA [Luteibacter sp. UNCMF366Tsu5.1]SFW31124.1 tRNA dimethylallyltransferase [Luteibacter sp. UNCMF366Tsu5.1]